MLRTRLALWVAATATALTIAGAGIAEARHSRPRPRPFPWKPSKAPEVDPGLARGALAVLAGGLLIFSDRRRRKG